jgi:magnesium-transporting ATPase (P-type)
LCKTKKCPCPTSDNVDENEEKKLRVDILGNQTNFNKIKDTLTVISRSDHHDKFALVTGISDSKQNVAVTGQFANEVNSFYKAHVGIATNFTGNNIVAEASDIIFLDKNLD